MSHLFISYSHQDMFWVKQFEEELRTCGHSVWIDGKNLQAGGIWNTEIEQAIAIADYMLVVVSRHSAKSDYVLKEIKHALVNDRRLVPIFIEEGNSQIQPLAQFDYRLNDMGHKLSAWQGYNFCAEYIKPFSALSAHLKGETPDYSRWDIGTLLSDPFPKLSDIAEKWLCKQRPRPRHNDLALLMDRNGLGVEAYYVAPDNEPFQAGNQPLSVFLQFSGSLSPDPFPQCLDYLQSQEKSRNGWQRQVVWIKGSQRKNSEGEKIYDLPIETLPQDTAAVWGRTATFIWDMIGKIADANGSKYFEFFLNTPNALSIMVAAKLKNRGKFDVYHYLVDEIQAQNYYHCVYSSGS